MRVSWIVNKSDDSWSMWENFNSNLGCCKNTPNNTCKYHYPKPFSVYTDTSGEGVYPDYRRRPPPNDSDFESMAFGNAGKKFIKRVSIEITNQWVVPYSPYLLKKFKCHINVEYCCTVASVKYLFMYQFKGEDLVSISIVKEADEISLYITRWYVSVCSAYWRIAEFKLTEIKTSILQFPLHMENEQSVTFEPTEEGAE